MNKPGYAGIYKQLGLEAEIASADPHKLIGLLYEGALRNLRQALAAEENGSRQARINALAKTIDILNGLLQYLSFEVESDLPYKLEGLYLYMIQRLLSAQARFDSAACKEVVALLEVLNDGWQQIGQTSP